MAVKLRAGVFYGDSTRTANASGFRFTESRYQAGLELPAHSHELAHFCLVLDGHYVERLGARYEQRRPSTLIFYPPDTVHAESSHSGGRHFLIEIESWRTAQMEHCAAFRQGPLVLPGQAERWIADHLVREFRDRDELSFLALESLALELMVNVGRRPFEGKRTDAPKWFLRVKQALDADFRQPPTLEGLAEMVDVHPVHLCRAFRRFQRCTIGEYVRQRRIEHARQKMSTSNDSLAEIALSSGFSDQSHFSRSFKRVTGLTPIQFRKLNRG